MLWSKSKTTSHTNRLHNKNTLATGHSVPLRIRASKPLNLRILAKEVDPEAFLRETPKPPTHSQAEWE